MVFSRTYDENCASFWNGTPITNDNSFVAHTNTLLSRSTRFEHAVSNTCFEPHSNEESISKGRQINQRNQCWAAPKRLFPSLLALVTLEEINRNGNKTMPTRASLQATKKSRGKNKSFVIRVVYLSMAFKNARSAASLGVWFTFRKAATETNINPTPVNAKTALFY